MGSLPRDLGRDAPTEGEDRPAVRGESSSPLRNSPRCADHSGRSLPTLAGGRHLSLGRGSVAFRL